MKKITTAQELIESGLLEAYVLEQASTEDVELVELLAGQYHEVKEAIESISIALEHYATEHAVQPSPAVKPFVMATLNYMARMEAGEQPENPPILNQSSTIAEYSEWLSRPDLQLKDELSDAFAYIIGHTPEAITAIVWLKRGAMPEVHHDEHEKFLVVEGTCCITFGDKEHHLGAGDCLTIPLHLDHNVRVTSEIPCKVILQRIAA